jgi:hypothetical protein
MLVKLIKIYKDMEMVFIFTLQTMFLFLNVINKTKIKKESMMSPQKIQYIYIQMVRDMKDK